MNILIEAIKIVVLILIMNGVKEAEEAIKAGANVNDVNEYEDTALMLASRNGHKDMVEMLIKAGAEVNAKNKREETALMLASRNGHKDMVEMLIKAGANVNDKEHNTKSALELSIEIQKDELYITTHPSETNNLGE